MSFRVSRAVITCVACTVLLAGSAFAQGGEFVGAEWGVPGARVDVTSASALSCTMASFSCRSRASSWGSIRPRTKTKS